MIYKIEILLLLKFNIHTLFYVFYLTTRPAIANVRTLLWYELSLKRQAEIMNNPTLGLENILAANGFTIALMGMAIVFLALTFIALFISQLPKILPLLAKVFPVEHQHAEPAGNHADDHEKVLAAIAYALFHKEAGSLPLK
jgi:sodium pump decarboxylase gamma subunit